MLFTRELCDYHVMPPNASIFPICLRPSPAKHGNKDTQQTVLIKEVNTQPSANLSLTARAYLTALGITVIDTNVEIASLIWMHALAISYSPAYLIENADGIRQDWLRVPLPDSRDLLFTSAELGRKVAMLLDTESAVLGVTSGKIRTELKPIAIIYRSDGGKLNPDAGELDVTVGWGYGGKEGITMPGKGKIVVRHYTLDERTALKEGAEALGLTVEEAIEHLGETTCDIYLNSLAHWKNIPSKVWNYRIGGYQVIKKWLSYREHGLLGRALTVEEVREVTNMARRVAAILLLEPALDMNYQAIKQSTYLWPTPSQNEVAHEGS